VRTFTFYSYKGGVGRTLVVANVARYLARFGQKVFAIDFDLEAPGLHYKLGLGGRELGTVKVERGLVDYLHAYFTKGTLPESIAPYTIEIPESGPFARSVYLMPAGAAPSAAYWNKLAHLDWSELFYSDQAPGVPLFLELKERIEEEFEPDFLLIDSRTGITETGGVSTTLLADHVVCLLLNNQENLEGAREVLRSIRRAERLPGQAPVEILPVISRIPEVGGEEEERLRAEIRSFLNQPAEDLAATLSVSEVLVLHTDPDLQVQETLRIGGSKAPEESSLLRDYLHLFGKLVSRDVLIGCLGPAIRQIAERWSQDKEGTRRDFEQIKEYSYEPELCEALLSSDIGRLGQTSVGGAEGLSLSVTSSLAQALQRVAPGLEERRPWSPQLRGAIEWREQQDAGLRQRGLGNKRDPGDLAQSGWGVIFPSDFSDAAAIRSALEPLLGHRRAQASQEEESFYREFLEQDGLKPGETLYGFLGRHRVGPGPANPYFMPYHLLLVGGPDSISYEFQYQLGINYSVGRLYFDTVDEYAQYAESVVRAEEAITPSKCEATLVGIVNAGDPVTPKLVQDLVQPLAESLSNMSGDGWRVRNISGEAATKEQVSRVLGGTETPSLLLVAGHGLSDPEGHSYFSSRGAMICSEWPGPANWEGLVPREFCFAAEDIAADAQVQGLILVLFVPYGAGTPRSEPYAGREWGRASIARLPQRLLGHPEGGALAAIGPVGDLWTPASSYLPLMEGFLRLLMADYPVGTALGFLNQRSAEFTADLSAVLQSERRGEAVESGVLEWLAFGANVRFIVLGDPAVRLVRKR
jgi:CobQ/CobB/MinD/ParA nucleotide binding domain